MKKLIIILASVFVLLLGLGAGYIFFIAPMMAANNPAVEGAATPKPKKKKEVALAYFSPGAYFVTNIKDSTRLLKLEVSLEYEENEEHAKELTTKQSMLREYIISVLRGCTEDELRADTAIEDLSTRMMEELKTKFEIDFVQAIYLTDFVIQ